MCLARTRVISIRINQNTQEILEKNAKILNLKLSVLAAKVLEDKTDDWAKEYAKRVYHELGLEDKFKQGE